MPTSPVWSTSHAALPARRWSAATRTGAPSVTRTCVRRSCARPRSRPLPSPRTTRRRAGPPAREPHPCWSTSGPPRSPQRASTPGPPPPRCRGQCTGKPEGKLDDAEIEALIVQLAAESPDPVSGLMSRLPESQSMRVILALMVGGALATLLVGLSYLLGLFVN